jgi:elongation factor P hydroxylase
VAAAIKDGLRLIDAAMRSTYWYYLDGTNQTAYSVKDLPDRLNYLITYSAPGSTFTVNCDLLKMTWKPSLNSFVRQAGGAVPNQPSLPVSLTTQADLDLSALNASINPPNPPSPPIVVITDLPAPSNLTTGH